MAFESSKEDDQMPKKNNRSCKRTMTRSDGGKMLGRRYCKKQLVKQARRFNNNPKHFELTPKLQTCLDWELY